MKRGTSGRSRACTRAEGRPQRAGRPRIIASPAEMDRLVDEYLQACAEAEEPITLTGMILHLGLSSRQSLDRYADRPEFSDAVKRAKLAIEHEYERRLDRTHPSGAIFALKNMGWSDRQVVEVGASLTSLDLTRFFWPRRRKARLQSSMTWWRNADKARELVGTA